MHCLINLYQKLFGFDPCVCSKTKDNPQRTLIFEEKRITEQILDEMNFGTDVWNLKGILSIVTLQMDTQVFVSIRHAGR